MLRDTVPARADYGNATASSSCATHGCVQRTRAVRPRWNFDYSNDADRCSSRARMLERRGVTFAAGDVYVEKDIVQGEGSEGRGTSMRKNGSLITRFTLHDEERWTAPAGTDASKCLYPSFGCRQTLL
jgi:hypothetical protein